MSDDWIWAEIGEPEKPKRYMLAWWWLKFSVINFVERIARALYALTCRRECERCDNGLRLRDEMWDGRHYQSEVACDICDGIGRVR